MNTRKAAWLEEIFGVDYAAKLRVLAQDTTKEREGRVAYKEVPGDRTNIALLTELLGALAHSNCWRSATGGAGASPSPSLSPSARPWTPWRTP